jgi:outer membrane protein TolC
MAEEALDDSRKAETERVRNPLDALRYQRQLLENLRLLESIDQELSSALIDLASLINAPVGQPLSIAQTDLKNISLEATQVPIARLEEAALMQNPDLREQHYNARIAREETRRTMVRLFPNVTFSYGLKYDSDSYLVNRHWNEAGLQMSFNLFNLMTGPTQIKLAEAGVALADQRRMASQMAVITQVHLARLQLINARGQFDRADAIYTTDSKIAQVMRSRQAAQAQSKLDAVSNETAAILSLLRRYQALAQVQAAENRLMATLGLEPQIGSTGELSLKDLTDQLGKSAAPWAKLGGKVAQAPADAGQSAAVPVAAAPAASAAAAAPVMAAAKATLVNAPGNVPAKPAASVAGKGKW